MRKKSKCITLFLFFLVSSLFAHDADIEITGENIYKAVRLPPLVYNASGRRLSDLLIKGSDGENVPYFINSSLQKTNASRETYPMTLINSYIKDNNFFFDYRLAAERNSDTIATSLVFSTRNTGFAKQMEVFGSYDNIYWEFVQSDILYVVDSKSKLAVNFNCPQKYTHYRLRLANNMEMISFQLVNLVFSQEINDETYFIEGFTPQFTVENEEKQTKIIIEGLKNLRLCDLQIETGSMFIRTVRADGAGSKELYNLSVNGTAYTDTTLPLNRHISQDETYAVIINNGDDKPIGITAITVRYFADDLVFRGSAGSTYTLEFGEDLTRAAPVYDIERYKVEILKGPIDRLVLGEIHYDQSSVEAGTETEAGLKEISLRIIFNIVVTLTALVLGVLIILKLKK
jgi:hypothetical protein